MDAKKIARKEMYQILRKQYPTAPIQVIKQTAYEMTNQAVEKLTKEANG